MATADLDPAKALGATGPIQEFTVRTAHAKRDTRSDYVYKTLFRTRDINHLMVWLRASFEVHMH